MFVKRYFEIVNYFLLDFEVMYTHLIEDAGGIIKAKTHLRCKLGHKNNDQVACICSLWIAVRASCV